MKKIFRFAFFGLFSLSLLPSCGLKKTAAGITAQVFKDGLPAIEEEQDVGFANQSSLASLKMLEALQRSNPKDKSILFMLARSYAAYTFGFVEQDILEAKGVNENMEKMASDRAKLFYGRGKKFGLLLLSQNASFKKSLEGTLDAFKKSLLTFNKKDVPNLFWTAFNWGSLLNFSKDSPDTIAEMPRIEALMMRVAELDPHYYYDGPGQFFGVFYAARPKMLGGQPEASKKAFDTAIEATQNKYLMIKVLKAQFYAVQIQDKNLFRSLLQEVLNADATVLPEQRLANEVAKKRAAILLSKEKLFF
ncbi:MAG: hypothetical protein HQM15_07695 [Deltaproteobacteria bacterium]|nr:hypothetical protein [Deltaproteobacteria bacterium]